MARENEYEFQIEVVFRSGRKVLTDPETQTESEVADLVRLIEKFVSTDTAKCSLTGIKVGGVHHTTMAMNPKEVESISIIVLSGPGLDD